MLNTHVEHCIYSMRRIIIPGTKFRYLTVLDSGDRRNSHGQRIARFKCECGVEKDFLLQRVIDERVKSCGCRSNYPNRGNPERIYINYMYGAYRSHSRKAKRVFNLTYLEFYNIVRLPCEYCGAKPEPRSFISKRPGKRVYAAVINGIDRVKSTAGYTVDNVVPCCKHCNRAKWEMSRDEFIAWIQRAYTHLIQSSHAHTSEPAAQGNNTARKT